MDIMNLLNAATVLKKFSLSSRKVYFVDLEQLVQLLLKLISFSKNRRVTRFKHIKILEGVLWLKSFL